MFLNLPVNKVAKINQFTNMCLNVHLINPFYYSVYILNQTTCLDYKGLVYTVWEWMGQPISDQCWFTKPPKNMRKHLVFWCFQGM